MLLQSALTLDDLELDVRLGVPQAERAQTQKIKLSLKFYFATPPVCAVDDNTDQFICYDEVAQAIRSYVAANEFRFIEHLAHRLHAQVRHYITAKLGDRASDVVLWIGVHKVSLPVDYPVAGARYVYCDAPQTVQLVDVNW